MTSLPSLIGVIHLPALAGAPQAHGEDPAESLQKAGSTAVKEAQILASAGFEGIILENFGDAPFFKDHVPPETISSMAVIAAAVREAVRIPVGINVLRNDARAALGIAAVTGCDFIRVNVLSGVAATDQGIIEGNAAAILRERDRLHAHVAILADVLVKHAQSLSGDEVEIALEEVALRSHADAVIVSGKTTGRLMDTDELEKASQTARKIGVPIYVGSGASLDSLDTLASLVNGVIVSSALRKGARAGAPLEAKRAREFAKTFFKHFGGRSSKQRKK